MKKRVDFFLAPAFSLLIAAIAYGQERGPAPAYQDGDFWVFRGTTKQSISVPSDMLEGDYEVSFSGGKFEVFQFVGGERGRVGPRTADRLKSMVTAGSEPTAQLRFPLTVGQKWTATFAYQPPRGQTPSSRTLETLVTGIQQVTTPAGTFQVFKIEGGFAHPSGVQAAYVYFYSPQARSIVKWNYDSAVGQPGAKLEIELIKFGTIKK